MYDITLIIRQYMIVMTNIFRLISGIDILYDIIRQYMIVLTETIHLM